MTSLSKLGLKKQQIIVVLFILFSFGNTIRNQYALDDNIVTTNENSKVAQGLSGIKEILTTPYSTAFEGTDAFEYRPVTQITFAIEKGVFGFKPEVSHCINLLLYIGVVLLLLNILRKLLAGFPSWIPFAVTLVFAIHPLHSEVVNSLKNREELLVSLFGFGALFFSMKYEEDKKWWHFMAVLLLLSLGINTKASFTPFVAVIPFTLAFFGKISWKKAGIVMTMFIAVCAIALFVPRSFIPEDLGRNWDYHENPLFFMSWAERLPMAFYSFLVYVKLHLIPYPLLSYYGYSYLSILGWSDYQVYLGILLLSVMVAVIVFSFRRNKLLCYGLMLYILFIIPYLNFPFPVAGIIAERFTFHSILGYSLILTAIASSLFLEKNTHFRFLRINTHQVRVYSKVYFFVSLGILILFTFININRTHDWKDFYTLMKRDANVAKKSIKLQNMYGDVVQLQVAKVNDQETKNSLLREAVTAYKRAIDLEPENGAVYNNIGVIYTLSGNYKMAISYFENAINLGESSANNYFNLGACYEMSGNSSKAIKYYQTAIKITPQYKEALERLRYLNVLSP